MEQEFWLQRWREGQLGFHQSKTNRWLESHWASLEVPSDAPVFVPLCGKSLDMRHLATLGHPVVGVDLSPIAAESFFSEAGESFELRSNDALPCYVGRRHRIFAGDFFALGADDLAGVRGVFDRAALIALPAELRRRYVEHLAALLASGTRILLLTIVYDQRRVDGPPFSVPRDEVEALYVGRGKVELIVERALEDTDLPPKFAGIEGASECVFRIELGD